MLLCVLFEHHLVEFTTHLALETCLAGAQGVLGEGGTDSHGADGATEQSESDELQVGSGECGACRLEVDEHIGKAVGEDLV